MGMRLPPNTAKLRLHG